MSSVQSHITAYDEVAGTYDELYRSPECLNENAAAFIRVREMLDSPLVDLGCGTGLLLEGLPEIDSDTYLGIDVSEGMLEQARRKFPGYRFERDCMTETAVRTGTVSAVVSLFSAANYVDLEELADEVARMLKPGGQFLLIFRRYRKADELEGIPKVSFIYSRDELSEAFLARGFESDLKITGLTQSMMKDLFLVVQGRRSA